MLGTERQAILDTLERLAAPEAEKGANEARVLPQIVTTGHRLRDNVEASLSALCQVNDPPTIFVRSGELVHVATDELGRNSIRSIQPNYLRGRLERAADYFCERKQNLIPIAPPMAIVNDILSLPAADWQFPPLRALTEVPILRPDGTVLTKSGYDAAMKAVFLPGNTLRVPTIPEHPSMKDAKAALSLVDEVLGEFPFAAEASRANTIALLLTAVVRLAIEGRVPLGLIDAPQAGTGKSLLTTVIAVIATGGEAVVMSAPQDEEEWRKAITANLSAGTPIIIYDNLYSVLHSASLSRVLTASQWNDRILGSSRTITLPQLVTWIATGNNIRLGGDLPRRCYWIRLDAQMSRSWTRGQFRHPDLVGWVKKHRGQLLAALLTIARAWYAAGKPPAVIPRIGGFEEWSTTVGGILAFAGVKGFLGNVVELYEQADDSTPQWEGFLSALCDVFAGTSFTVAELVQPRSLNRLKEHLPEELAAAWGNNEAPSTSFKVKLGKALRKRVGTRYGTEGLHLVRDGAESRGGCVRWRVAAGLQGSQGAEPSGHTSVSNTSEGKPGDTTLQTLQPCEIGPSEEDGAVDAGVEPCLMQNTTSPDERCFSCGGARFRPLRHGGWVCEACHPAM